MAITIKPRGWQAKAIAHLVKCAKDGARNYLLVATPGAGKTLSALFCVRELIEAKLIDRIVVVTPGRALKRQWSSKARDVGLSLMVIRDSDDLGIGQLPLGVLGLVTTYQQVASCFYQLRNFVEDGRTLVILDEVHHAAKGKSWGDAITEAFAPSIFRLCLSGTPFREDTEPMPFVAYSNHDHTCIPDFTYSYEQAVRDGVCRPVEFPYFDGQMRWSVNGGERVASFDDAIKKRDRAARLRTAVHAKGEMVRNMIAAADQKLDEIRTCGGVHATAGGLVIGFTQEHCEELARIVKEVTGERPTRVSSEVEGSHEAIRTFADGGSKWIVAVKMISEGIDIPRLRVGVFGTVITTSLHFRQFVGRFVRVQENAKAEKSFVFLPGDPELLALAEQIEKEKCHALGEEYKAAARLLVAPRRETTFLPLEATGDEGGVVLPGKLIPTAMLEEARSLRSEHPTTYVHMTDAEIARVIMGVRQREVA